jgi:hypothetical protein
VPNGSVPAVSQTKKYRAKKIKKTLARPPQQGHICKQ